MKINEENNTQVLVKGMAMLAAAGIIVKILGALFRIPLANVIGPYGMAIYQPAYSIYAVVVAFATIGLPVALSKSEISEKNIFKITRKIILYIAIPISIILFVFAGQIGHVIGIEEAKITLRTIAPVVVFLSVTACFRGFFQAKEDMLPTGFSQVIEQFFRVLLGLGLAICFYYEIIYIGDIENSIIGGFGAILGTTIASMIGTIIILTFFAKRWKQNKADEIKVENDNQESFYDLMKTTIIITVSLAIFQIFSFVEIPIIVNRLMEIGYENSDAINIYGQISGLIYPIINLPYVLLSSFAIVVVPAISKLNVDGASSFEKINDKSKVTIGLSGMIGIPAAAGIALLGNDILFFLYPSQQDEIILPNSIILIFACSVAILSFLLPTIGILQGMDEGKKVCNCAIFAILCKCILAYFLTGIENIGALGSPLSTTIGFSVMFFMLLVILRKKKNISIRNIYELGLKIPVLGSLIMLVCGGALKYILIYLDYTKFQALLITSEQSEISFFSYINEHHIFSSFDTLIIIVVSMIIYGVIMLANKNKIKVLFK